MGSLLKKPEKSRYDQVLEELTDWNQVSTDLQILAINPITSEHGYNPLFLRYVLRTRSECLGEIYRKENE